MALLMPNLQESSFLRSLINLIYNFILFIYLAVLGLHCCVDFSLVVASNSYCLVVVHELLIAVASFVVDHRL